MQKRRCTWIWMLLGFFVFCLSANAMAAAKEASSIIGKQTWNFNLASTQDTLINYGDVYYGKSYLLMTFFPAAFTPV